MVPFCILILFVTCMTDSGDNEGVTLTSIDNDNLADRSRDFPKCDAKVSALGKLPTWTDLLKHLNKAWLKTSNSWEQVEGAIDPKIKTFVQLTSATLYSQVFACLPQYVSQPDPEERYDDYAPLDEDGGK